MSTERGSGAGSLLGRLLGRAALIERHELPAVVAAFCLFFCVLGGYFAVRPVRETIGTILGRERVADLYVVTWIASVAIVPIYGAIVGRYRRSVFLPWIYGFVALALAGVGITLHANEKSVLVGEFFYVFISVLNLFLVSVFWSFLLELFDTTQTKRLFGIIASGGTAGALVGPAITFLTVNYIGDGGVLLLGAGLFAVAIVCQRALLRIWSAQAHGGHGAVAAAPAVSAAPAAKRGGAVRGDRAIGGNPFAGFTLVARSPYLLAIALFVVFLAAANTFLYFEQLRLVTTTFASIGERTRVFAALDWIVQTLTILAQLFLTGRIALRLGVVALLTVLPVVMIFGFLAIAAVGTFTMLAIVIVVRRVGEYAFIRPGREILFSKLDNETKYKAKNLIDVPVYRGSDAFVAQLNAALHAGGLGPAAVAVLGAAFAAGWAVNGWWLGRRHDGGAAQPAPRVPV